MLFAFQADPVHLAVFMRHLLKCCCVCLHSPPWQGAECIGHQSQRKEKENKSSVLVYFDRKIAPQTKISSVAGLQITFAVILTYSLQQQEQQVPVVILRVMAVGSHKVTAYGNQDLHYPKTVLSGQQFECHHSSLWSMVVFIWGCKPVTEIWLNLHQFIKTICLYYRMFYGTQCTLSRGAAGRMGGKTKLPCHLLWALPWSYKQTSEAFSGECSWPRLIATAVCLHDC